MPVVYTEENADLSLLEGRNIAVIGYADDGRAVALNLRDNGLIPIIGEANEVRAAQAEADGFEVRYPSEAAEAGEIKILMQPDELLPEVYMAHVAPVIKRGDTLVFPSGYTIAFGFVEPPPFVDAMMIAPRLGGEDLRELFVSGKGVLSFLSVTQDASGHAWPHLLALARAMGALRGGGIELTAQQEAELDLFMQQGFLPALHHLMLTASEILIREGYPPEAALLSLYVSGELAHMLNRASQRGMMDTLRLYSLTGQYGMLSRAERFLDPKMRRQMETILEEIRSGKFAQEWANEYHNGYPRLEALRNKREAMALWGLEHRALELLRLIRPSEDDQTGG